MCSHRSKRYQGREAIGAWRFQVARAISAGARWPRRGRSPTSPRYASKFTIDAFCTSLSQERGRPIRLAPLPDGNGSPCGLWVATAEVDWVFHQVATSPLAPGTHHPARARPHDLRPRDRARSARDAPHSVASQPGPASRGCRARPRAVLGRAGAGSRDARRTHRNTRQACSAAARWDEQQAVSSCGHLATRPMFHSLIRSCGVSARMSWRIKFSAAER